MENVKIDKGLLPDFLIIGAGKSGTTSLDSYMNQHPDLFISPVKEPNFFGYEMVDINELELPETKEHYKESVTDLSDYQDLFREARPNQLKGETSNLYLYSDTGHQRIKHYVPDAKLIAILRQPAERLYSRFLHLARVDLLPTPQFEDLFEKGNIWWKRPDLINEGMYFRHLEKFYTNFPKENIRVFLYDEFRSDPQKLMQDMYTFLGVREDFQPDTDVQLNQSGFIKNKLSHKIIGPNGVIFGTIKKIAPTIFEKAKKSNKIQGMISNMRSKNLHRPKLSPETKRRVTDEIYRKDIESLQTLIDKDLKHWLDF